MPVYKDEIRKTWYASFYYVDWNGTRKKKKKEGFKKQSEAKEFEREFIKKQGGGSDMVFASLVELYKEDSKSRLRATTYENKCYIINSKILPTFKDTPLNAITPAMIRKWQNELMKPGQNYSPTYLKTINNQISAILNFSVRYYGLSSNPVVKCGSMGKKNAESMKFWTLDVFKNFIDYYKNNLRYFTVFNTFFYTGVRSGEFLALTLDDFDFTNNVLHITKSYARVARKDIIGDPKTPKSKRDITIPKFLCKIIQDYANALVDYKSNERLFCFTKHTLQKELKHGCDYTGVAKIRVHDLRHSHASLLIEMGFSPILVSERLGHDNIETTLQTYSHLYPNKHSAVAEKLDQLNK